MKRNNYSAELKAEVVLEVLAGLKTVQQIEQERGMHPVTITSWVKEARRQDGCYFQRGDSRSGSGLAKGN